VLQEFKPRDDPCWATSLRADSDKGAAFLFSLSNGARIQDTTKRVRVNKQIRISPIRVIAADGAQLGIMDVETALAAAIEQGLDLVEVAPMARPPVARIMDYGKFKFEQAKMARQAKKKQHVIHLKEVKYRPGGELRLTEAIGERHPQRPADLFEEIEFGSTAPDGSRGRDRGDDDALGQ